MHRRKKLIFWRIEQRMKQRDVADKLGITVVHYSNIERGLSNPSYEVLLKFREVFKIKDALEMFDKEENQNGYNDTSGDFGEEQVLD